MLYIVQMTPNAGVNIANVQNVLSDLGDWYRLAMWCWVVDTDRNANHVANRMNQFVAPNGECFVCRLHPADRQGYKTNEFWNWLAERG